MNIEITIGNKRHGDTGFYVGRPSPLGNPFEISRKVTREQAIKLYEEWLRGRVEAKDPLVLRELARIWEAAVRGPVTLVCWCHPKPCHAEVVKKVLAESLESV